jgi:hypothetical protein
MVLCVVCFLRIGSALYIGLRSAAPCEATPPEATPAEATPSEATPPEATTLEVELSETGGAGTGGAAIARTRVGAGATALLWLCAGTETAGRDSDVLGVLHDFSRNTFLNIAYRPCTCTIISYDCTKLFSEMIEILH